ncbi:MAG: acetyl/propionyl/methylcrotonyl-CoA carboxylase subunit alpha [Pseudomonadota bacterium]
MFEKILVANRGEIACRIIATASRLGVGTVAIYSDADQQAKHVAMADEAVHVGEAPVAKSYLCIERIVEAAQATSAQAIHPGYGFLSENPAFVETVESAGLVFIGPTANAIRAMGLKDAAKVQMERAGVPVVPGYHGGDQDVSRLQREADRIGYPVLIKARAGGGGKGMRLVQEPQDFAAALEGARREASASFGDPDCLIERFITQPRHVEIQVFADCLGNVVHLFERDCSLQRRHQKVIEEAPAPDMPEAVRAAMGQAAVEAARAIGYVGAGTVEFIADGSRGLREDGFWFMEMNTRLQVEHPVSEAITGQDFVELQLRIAAGEPLPFTQGDLSIQGWSFEARIYAEDVPSGFLPAIGKLEHLAFPVGQTFEPAPVRIDSGVRQGDVISPFYDPMIAKLIVHGPDRETALSKLRKALAKTNISGLVTNLSFLSALSLHEGFNKGIVDTGLIARDLDDLIVHSPPSDKVVALAGLLASGILPSHRDLDPWSLHRGWRHWGEAEYTVRLKALDLLERRIRFVSDDRFRITGGDESFELKVESLGYHRYALTTAGHRMTASAVRVGSTIAIFSEGQSHHFEVPDALQSEGRSVEESGDVLSPMPGLVKVVMTEATQKVSKGDALIVLEAMKMEHTLTAPKDGIVTQILTEPGAQVDAGALLLTLTDGDVDERIQ